MAASGQRVTAVSRSAIPRSIRTSFSTTSSPRDLRVEQRRPGGPRLALFQVRERGDGNEGRQCKTCAIRLRNRNLPPHDEGPRASAVAAPKSAALVHES
jgi:hypothetical protein